MHVLAALWLPMLVAPILVFVASSLIHMVFKWHNADYKALPNEDAVREVMRKANAAPGMYVIPHCPDMKEMGSETMKTKFREGPVGMVFLRPSGDCKIGTSLAQWFVFILGVSVFTAFVAAHALVGSFPYLHIFCITASFAFAAYGGGAFIAGIWMGQPWGAVAKDVLDALIYAGLTGGAFGWLWPR
jgi:hypothetical protein